MSSYTHPNFRQSFEKLENDPVRALERLRRIEIRLWVEREVGVHPYLYRNSHDGHEFFTTSSDDYYYPIDRIELARLDKDLEHIREILQPFYHYDREYIRIITNHTWEYLPIDWEKCTHDGFWGHDPTWTPREPHL